MNVHYGCMGGRMYIMFCVCMYVLLSKESVLYVALYLSVCIRVYVYRTVHICSLFLVRLFAALPVVPVPRPAVSVYYIQGMYKIFKRMRN